MEIRDIVVIVAVALGFGVSALIFGLAMLLRHREKMRTLQAESVAESKRVRELESRIQALESRCEKMEERVADAHVLMSDEQRLLDAKLSAMLPPLPAGGGENESARYVSRERRKE